MSSKMHINNRLPTDSTAGKDVRNPQRGFLTPRCCSLSHTCKQGRTLPARINKALPAVLSVGSLQSGHF